MKSRIIRASIMTIGFILFLYSLLPRTFKEISLNPSRDPSVYVIFLIVLIFGAGVFMKLAPQLPKDDNPFPPRFKGRFAGLKYAGLIFLVLLFGGGSFLGIIGGIFIVAFFYLFVRYWSILSGIGDKPDTFGSAEPMQQEEIFKYAIYRELIHMNVVVGLYEGKDGYYHVTPKKPGHLITVAPTRSGKGVSQIVPNLLAYQGSMVVNDLKGENFDITAKSRFNEHRKNLLGKYPNVNRLAPGDPKENYWIPTEDDYVDGGDGNVYVQFPEELLEEHYKYTRRYNPLVYIRKGTHDELDDAKDLAEFIIEPSQKGDAAYWDSEAKELLAAFMLYVLHKNDFERANLGEVRRLLMQSQDGFLATLTDMEAGDHETVARLTAAFIQKADKEQSAVLSTLKNKTSIWDSELVRFSTSANDMSFEDLLSPDSCTTIYICIPPDKQTTYKPLFRLYMGIAIRTMTRNQGKPPEIPVVFMIDEMSSLGRMSVIEEGIDYLAGYGARLWLFFQDFNKMKSIYGQHVAQSMFANCRVRSFFGVNDMETARMVSDMMGQQTVGNQSRSVQKKGMFEPDQVSETYSHTGRPLLTPDEVMRLPERRIIAFFQGEKPASLAQWVYYEDKGLLEYGGLLPSDSKEGQPDWAV